MKSKTKLGLIVIFIMMVNFTIGDVKAWEEEQTRHIEDTYGDFYVTEAGLGFYRNLVTVLDPNMDIYSYLYFPDIKINYWESLINATLRLRTSYSLPFDANSSFTIYGVDDYIHFGSGTTGYGPIRAPGEVISVPKTEAHVNVNSSQFFGYQWHEIDVTNIVQEMKSNQHWDGPGYDIDNPGDNMAFVMLGAEGHESRWFFDFSSGNNYEAQLHLHWTDSPSPPDGYPGADFNESYRDYNIWTYNGSDYGWINYNDYTFINVSNGQVFEIVSDDIITGDQVRGEDTYDFRLWRTTISQERSVLMSINITEVIDTTDPGFSYPIHLFGHANANKNVYDIDNDLNKGVFLTVSTIDNNTDGIFHFVITTHNAGTWNILYSTEFRVDWNLRYYLNVTYDYPNQDFGVSIYNSSSFDSSSFIETIERTGYVNIMTAYGNEFGFNTHSRPAETDRVSFNTLSQSGTTWIVTDENGTVVLEDLESYDEALLEIENLLGADPQDPDPPGQDWDQTGPFTRFKTRLYIFMFGVAMMWGPVMFFAYRRPSGYNFVVGLFIMLMGLGLLIHAGSV